ncbi:MAG TPA: hypothetical protein VL461_14600 [Dictyobacter sp.]|nr:hypothetical protein [Dictyobacter sp.]
MQPQPTKTSATTMTTNQDNHVSFTARHTATLIQEPHVLLTSLEHLLKHYQAHFTGRAMPIDIDIFRFNLLQLFRITDHIMMELLPVLTFSTQVAKGQPQYGSWHIIQECASLFRHLDPFCQLLISTTVRLLERLDSTCHIYASPSPHTWQLTATNPAITESLQQPFTTLTSAKQEDSQEIMPLLTTRLAQWSGKNNARPSFRDLFPSFLSAIPTLLLIDPALESYLENTHAIFSAIMHDTQPPPANNDEIIAIQLLDITQKIDQIMISLDIINDTLHSLGQSLLTAS